MFDTLLVEVRTEELPPPAVRALAQQFPKELLGYLKMHGFADGDAACCDSLATPRRFAALIPNVRAQTESQNIKRRGPQLKDCYDEGNKPSAPLQGFMRTVGEADADKLGRENINGKDYIVWRGTKPGVAIGEILEKMVLDSLMLASAYLPAMRWNDEGYIFIRPVHGLIMMLGKSIIKGEVMGVQSANITRGHPVLASGDITIASAAEYVETLRKAKVIIDYNERAEKIKKQPQRFDDDGRFYSGDGVGSTSNPEEREKFANVNAALCEYPTVYRGTIDKAFWDFPPECMESCLIKHQKCLPFFSREDGPLKLKTFFFVADNAPKNSDNIINGFNAVVRARLRDADFYMGADNKMSAEEAHQKLGSIVYHHKLGSQQERAERIINIATAIGGVMQLDDDDKEKLRRAAEICKLDFPTMMVGEYPELAGIIASMMPFCKLDVVNIVKRHGDKGFMFYMLDDTALPSIALFLADKLEKIVGMFIIGEKPAKRKDPHGLRRAARQIADMLAPPHASGMSKEVAEQMGGISITELIRVARIAFANHDKQDADSEEVREFIVRRISLPRHIKTEVSNAVYVLRPDYLAQIPHRCEALQSFLRHPQAAVLIAANKRINNILRKSPPADTVYFPDLFELREQAERALYECITRLEQQTKQLPQSGDYEGTLKLLAEAASPIGEFFDKCMVNDEDADIRKNRLALLFHLQRQLNAIADLSML